MANQPSKYSKFLVGAASAALVASAVAPIASAADFKDTKGNTHEVAINALSDAGIIKGYTDGSFQPNKTLTRSDVVKMMGKWLVTEGATIPEDAVSNPRFTDLTSTSNKELLEYAAVVKDNDVFIGSNGKLLAGDNITRENMALVLVRAFDKVNDIDLVAYVAGQDFKKDVKDLSSAKAEAQGAINVLDFFDITNPAVANFNPKGSTTRGQFATFLHKTLNSDFSVVAVGAVKAINTTTVEVTFKEDVKDINSLKFSIEGLKVENAAVKQTDAKTVVLTTATQEGGKKYTVKLGETKIGDFTGISAVIPEKVTMVTTSLQGIVGKEITVKADIGVKAAGVPVTFNVVANTNNSLNPNQVVEAFTNADGIAEYSYTRYAVTEDTVQVYATGKANVRTTGKVYWANAIQLAVTELTTGNDLSNETKKSYKVAGKANTTYYIAIKENLNVAPDKITNVNVQKHISQITNVDKDGFTTPYELTTGRDQFAYVTTNANGEASFTMYGTNLEATPIVYLPSSVNADAKDYSYSELALQHQAPTVKFSQVDRLAITVAGEGTADSAEYFGTSAPVAFDANSAGGRTYTVTVTDKEGKIAPAGTTAYVSFGDMAGDVYFTTATNNFVKVSEGDIKTVTVGKDGKVQFRVAGKGATSFVKPTVFLNTAGKVSPVALDKADVQAVAEVTYFKSPIVTNAALTVKDKNGREITSLVSNEDAYFTYQSVDQNGFAYRPGSYTIKDGTTTIIYVQEVQPDGTIAFVPKEVKVDSITSSNYVLAFDVTSTFGTAVVKNANGIVLPAVQNIGSTKTYNVTSDANGVAVVRVTSQSADTVSVNVTGASNILPTATASVSFTNANTLPAVFTGNATINAIKEEITFVKANGQAYQAVSYATARFTQNNVNIGKTKFEALVSADMTAGKYSDVTANVDANGIYTFDYRGVGNALPTPPAVSEIAFTNSTFDASSPQVITVKDADLNIDATVAEKTTVAVSGTGASFIVTLTETGVNTGVFAGTLTAAQLALFADGTITATHDGKTATATLKTSFTDLELAKTATTAATVAAAAAKATPTVATVKTANDAITAAETAIAKLAAADKVALAAEIATAKTDVAAAQKALDEAVQLNNFDLLEAKQQAGTVSGLTDYVVNYKVKDGVDADQVKFTISAEGQTTRTKTVTVGEELVLEFGVENAVITAQLLKAGTEVGTSEKVSVTK